MYGDGSGTANVQSDGLQDVRKSLDLSLFNLHLFLQPFSLVGEIDQQVFVVAKSGEQIIQD